MWSLGACTGFIALVVDVVRACSMFRMDELWCQVPPFFVDTGICNWAAFS